MAIVVLLVGAGVFWVLTGWLVLFGQFAQHGANAFAPMHAICTFGAGFTVSFGIMFFAFAAIVWQLMQQRAAALPKVPAPLVTPPPVKFWPSFS